MRIGKHFNPKEAASRRNLGAAFNSKLAELDLSRTRPRHAGGDTAMQAQLDQLRDELRRHPSHKCSDRESHARAAERALRLERETERLQARMATRTNTIANHFDKICLVLESLDYLTGEGGATVSQHGRMLARIYAELDLVAAECIRACVLDDLSPPQLAAVLSALVYESRRTDEGPRRPRLPDARTSSAIGEVRRIWREVSLVERDARLDGGPEPDIGFCEVAYGWAAGRSLGAAVEGSDLTAGDFVRWIRQVIDFAGQVADAAGPGPLRDAARSVVNSMRRGVVTYAPEIDAAEGDDIDGSDYP
jgi:ATP-dependent RNA helicase HelY